MIAQNFKLKTNNLLVFLFSLACLSFMACNATEGKELTLTENISQVDTQPENNPSSLLKQTADYSDLFNANLKNCDFLTVSEFANASNVQPGQISIEENGYDCKYLLKDDKGLLTRFQITNNPMKKKAIEKEIKSLLADAKTLGKDSRLVEVRESDTGDTYLIMNQDRHVKLLNPNYESFVNVAYTPIFDAKEKDVEFINTKKTEMRNKAFAIANALLKKYKK